MVTSHYARLREVGEGEMEAAVWTRCGFMVVGFMASAVLYYVGKRQLWGEGASSFVAKAFADIIAIVVFFGFVCTFTANVLTTYHLSGTEEQRMFWMAFESFFFFMVLVHLCSLSPHSVMPVFLCLVVIICTLGYVGILTSESDLMLECAGSSVFLLMMHLIAKMWDPRRANVEHKSICEEHERVSELLDSMLPREVLSEMKSGHLSLAYNYKDMTMLFADIVGFTRYCAEHTAEQAVNLVTKLFAEFDEQVLKLGVYKVCTIGDAYVAVNEPRTEVLDKFSECAHVLEMAIYMLQTINRVRDEVNHTGLDMRIGLHIGRFVGGVIGTKRLRFDIWGEDVLIGNNVESHGRPGEIAVSNSAKEVLEACVGDLQYTFNEEIKLKTGRVVRTYICRPSNGESFAERLLQ